MAIKVITGPAAVLTLAELRLHLKLDTTDGVHPDDTLIAAQLEAARAYAEHYTRTSIGSQTLELALDAFPCADAPGIRLLQGPVASITSVKYIDTAGTEQTLATDAYSLDDYSVPAWLLPAVDTDWPDTLDTANAVKVRYVAGSATLAPQLRAALLLIVGHLYANRTSVAPGNLAEVPMGACALLDTVKDWSQ